MCLFQFTHATDYTTRQELSFQVPQGKGIFPVIKVKALEGTLRGLIKYLQINKIYILIKNQLVLQAVFYQQSDSPIPAPLNTKADVARKRKKYLDSSSDNEETGL